MSKPKAVKWVLLCVNHLLSSTRNSWQVFIFFRLEKEIKYIEYFKIIMLQEKKKNVCSTAVELTVKLCGCSHWLPFLGRAVIEKRGFCQHLCSHSVDKPVMFSLLSKTLVQSSRTKETNSAHPRKFTFLTGLHSKRLIYSPSISCKDYSLLGAFSVTQVL